MREKTKARRLTIFIRLYIYMRGMLFKSHVLLLAVLIIWQASLSAGRQPEGLQYE